MSLRPSRNIEHSIYYFLSNNLSSDWNNVSIVKGFQKAYESTLPVVALRLGDSNYNPVEIGNNNYRREVSYYIDVFGNSDAQSEDLKDYLIDLLKDGCIYYEHTIVGGAVTERVDSGRIRISEIRDTHIKIDTDKNGQDVHDRHRIQIRMMISIGKVE